MTVRLWTGNNTKTLPRHYLRLACFFRPEVHFDVVSSPMSSRRLGRGGSVHLDPPRLLSNRESFQAK